MANKQKIFIGVAWPYVNGDIHIGHLAGYLLPADIFARFHRLMGNDVLMVSGSDCYGTPITLEADKRGVLPQQIVDEYHPKNIALFKKLDISFDWYTKTDTAHHKRIVQDLFIAALHKGYIFKRKSKQYYSENEKRFLPDRYVRGVCSHCGYGEARGDQCENCGLVLQVGELKEAKSNLTGQPVILKETEHYFFDWPRLQSFLENYVAEKRKPLGEFGAIWRPWVAKETQGWLERGLQARPITRDLDWGVEIPIERIPEDLRLENYENKRIYVWFEAVVGYLSASIEARPDSWQKWWYERDSFHAYFMGKDNLVFHTLFWPGELYVYDEKIHLPDLPVINQFLNLEGQKFSKSRGITIDPAYFADNYGLDALRFYLTLIAPESADTNFNWADFVRKNNDVLVGNFGNFINRTLNLAKDLNFKKAKVNSEILKVAAEYLERAKFCLAKAEFKNYAETIINFSDFGNKYLSQKEPWFLKGKDNQKFEEVLFNDVYLVLVLLLMTAPLAPNLKERLSAMLGVAIEKWDENLEKLLQKIKIGKVEPLFRKLEESVIDKERSKIAKVGKNVLV